MGLKLLAKSRTKQHSRVNIMYTCHENVKRVDAFFALLIEFHPSRISPLQTKMCLILVKKLHKILENERTLQGKLSF